MSSKPKFNPNLPYEAAPKPKFDPNQPYEAVKPVEGPSELESGLRGVAQGATMGFADEGIGALEAGKDLLLDPNTNLDNVTDKYSQHRDESRKNFKSAKEANPYSYGAGELAGGAATLAIPGLGGAKAATLAGRVGQGILAGGRVGAISGLGSSESEDLGGMIRDTGKGAALGSVVGGATPVVIEKAVAPLIQKGIQKGNEIFQKAIRGATDTSEEMVQRAKAVGGSEALKAAPSRTENTQNLLERIKNLKDRTVDGSKASREILASEGVVLPKDKIKGAIQAEIDSIKSAGAFTEDVDRTLSRLERLKGSIDKAEGDLPGGQVKSLIQQIDDYAFKGTQGAADFGKSDTNSFKSLRRALDTDLKTKSTAYADQMASVAKDTDLLSKAKGAGRNPQAAVKNQMGNSPNDKTSEVFQGLGLADDLERAKVAKYFNASTTNGSRKTMAGGAIGGGVGWLLGPLGSAGGSAVGAAAGAALDKSGRGLALKATELATRLESKALSLGKYSKVLAEAAAKGPGVFLVTHEMLSRDPGYQAALQESE